MTTSIRCQLTMKIGNMEFNLEGSAEEIKEDKDKGILPGTKISVKRAGDLTNQPSIGRIGDIEEDLAKMIPGCGGKIAAVIESTNKALSSAPVIGGVLRAILDTDVSITTLALEYNSSTKKGSFSIGILAVLPTENNKLGPIEFEKFGIEVVLDIDKDGATQAKVKDERDAKLLT